MSGLVSCGLFLLIDHLVLKKVFTVKDLNIRTTENFAVIILNIELYRVTCPNNNDGIANSVDPDQTAPMPGCQKKLESLR